ncbi:MAG: hypothetical protein COB67_02040 [SAR324 cluster bacterium]|uniref:DUF615 domain-containing protein n=1 Tax=SAR324 cluster bacterium TaxID=2024889 RepID=A0A2A4TA81_9DELT|nr:MAG: hypothetical protein COB67_02040 [SAR324 cluster bacterium]
MRPEEEENELEDTRKSRSQIKREMTELQGLGEQLLTLGKVQLGKLDLPERLLEAVLQAKKFKRGEALRRQIQLIGAYMRDIDPEPLKLHFENLTQGNRQQLKAIQEVERWRDRLIEGDKQLLDELGERFSAEWDLQRVRQFIRNAQKEKERSKPPKAFRSLYRYLKELAKV